MDSSDSSGISPLKIQKRNRWITPEKEKPLSGIPNTILGIQPASKGSVKDLWVR